MAEKILKGYLVFKGKKFPKIHDLDRLVKLCQEFDKSFKRIKPQARYLSNFYITTRYPGDYPEFNWKEAEKAFRSAIKIKNFVLEKLEFL